MAKGYGLGKDTFKSKHYKVKKFKGRKIGQVLKKSNLKSGKKNKIGLG